MFSLCQAVGCADVRPSNEHVKSTWYLQTHPLSAETLRRVQIIDYACIISGCDGLFRFLLENHRTDVRIGFFYNGFKHPRLAGSTHTIKFKNPDIPSHGRIALTGDNTQMLVQWTTASDSPGVVQWGSEPGKYPHTVESKTMTYTRHEMCGGAAKHVRIRALVRSTATRDYDADATELLST